MRYRPLGATGITVSEIGFGAWGIGGATPGATSYGRTDDAVSERALARAVEQGITFFDTAPAYGYGHSETLLGRLLRGRRDKLVIATKAGVARYDAPPDFTPAGIEQSLAGSLARLGTDYVDLLQLHNASVALLREQPAILACLDRLSRSGRIRAWGLSVKSPADGAAAAAELGARVIQCNFNMLDVRAVESGLLGPGGPAVIARTPLCFGFLSGAVDASTRFDAADHRSSWPRPQVERWSTGAAAIFARFGLTGTERSSMALRFCLSHPGVASVIPGMLTAAEVDANAAVSAQGMLPAADLAWIEANARDEPLVAAGGVRPA